MEDNESLLRKLKNYLTGETFDTRTVMNDAFKDYETIMKAAEPYIPIESEMRIPIKLGQDKLLNWLRKRSTSICDKDFDLITTMLLQGYYTESNKYDLNRIRIKWTPLYLKATNK